jgi:predicted DNA-binding transcriptional regulator AlpA
MKPEVSIDAVVSGVKRAIKERKEQGIPATLKHWNDLPDGSFVRLPTVAGLLDCSGATVWRMVQQGHLPKPHKFGARVSAWSVGELRQVLKAR